MQMPIQEIRWRGSPGSSRQGAVTDSQPVGRGLPAVPPALGQGCIGIGFWSESTSPEVQTQLPGAPARRAACPLHTRVGGVPTPWGDQVQGKGATLAFEVSGAVLVVLGLRLHSCRCPGVIPGEILASREGRRCRDTGQLPKEGSFLTLGGQGFQEQYHVQLGTGQRGGNRQGQFTCDLTAGPCWEEP